MSSVTLQTLFVFLFFRLFVFLRLVSLPLPTAIVLLLLRFILPTFLCGPLLSVSPHSDGFFSERALAVFAALRLYRPWQVYLEACFAFLVAR